VVGRPAFDFDRPETIAAACRAADPWLVVNAAAYTAVDAAETDEAAAMRANRDGPAELARFCAAAGIPLIHVSTDYVYDGQKPSAYVESDPTAPASVYGVSKLAGEQAVLASGARAIILRTAWVYGATGRNFVRTMLNLALTRDSLRVVADQHGCPTAAADLAAVILAIASRIEAEGWQDAWAGVFHAAGSGETTWHGLAIAVFEAAARHGAKVPASVVPIATADYPTPASRPANSRLDCTRLATVFGIRLPDWRESLARTVGEICAA
jgi:dTDP-4-dehydrorhamnose reductase